MVFIASYQNVFAARLELKPSKVVVGSGEQFYVDLMLHPDGDSINLINGTITFQDDYVSFVRVEEGKSIVNLWIKKPTINLHNNTFSFAGVINNGFRGVIDPFDSNNKLPGIVVRLIFEGRKPGKAFFSTSKFDLNKNDGFGTSLQSPGVSTSVIVADFIYNKKQLVTNNSSPFLEVYVTKDKNIYNDKHVLIFNAFDKDSGIKNVKIKEGGRDWLVSQSPYLLKDQSRSSYIYIQATNYNNVSVVKTIEPLNSKMFILRYFVYGLLFILLCIVLILFYRKLIKNKHV